MITLLARRLALSIVLVAPQSFAQQRVSIPGTPSPIAAPPSVPPEEPPSWISPSEADDGGADIDFPGGPIREYFRGLRAQWPDLRGKITAPIEVEEFELPAFKLRGVDRLTALVLPTKLIGGIHITNYDATPGMANNGFFFHADSSLMRIARSREARTIDIDFPGGTIDAYVAAIRKVCPDANIVIMDGAGKETLPAVSFRSVSLDAATKTMEIRRRNADGTVTEVFVRGLGMGGGGSQEVYKVEMETTAPNPMAAEVARVWSLAVPIANGTKVEDLLSAIEAALGVSDRPTTIKYHEATSLLIVRALPSQQDLVDEVIRKVAGTTAARKMTPDNGAR